MVNSEEALLDEFKCMEIKNNLFDICVDDIYVWELIRGTVFKQISEKKFGSNSKSGYSFERTLTDYVSDGRCLAKNIVKSKLSEPPQVDILYFGGGRRMLHFDNYWWNIYIDPVISNIEKSQALLETSYHLKHMTPAKTNNIMYADSIYEMPNILFEFISPEKILPLLGCDNLHCRNDQIKRIKDIIDDEFSVWPEIMDTLANKAAKLKIKLPRYEKLLEEVDPQLVILAWTESSLVHACKNKKIPTIKIQKGRRHKFFLKYNYPNEITSTNYFADYKFVWGEYWKNCVNYPVPNENVIPVGFPYLELSKNSLNTVTKGKNVLFISATPYGKELSELAVELSNLTSEYNILYKLHPRNEGKIWRELYPWLEHSEVNVIDHGESHLYELFARSEVQVGVDSTSILEGLYFGLDTYLLDHPNTETLKDIIEKKDIEKIDDASQLIHNIKSKDNKKIYMNDVFESRSIEKTVYEILNILNKHA